MLELCKKVLNGVQEDKELFRKELIKSMAWLNREDQTKLKDYVQLTFADEHADVIQEVLSTQYDFAS
ncbi:MULTISPECIES: hypothetical protein [unclassified Carboxylicivirga]|uniref:hypothetical protein n=1 Tax=Carboxylicivirga TaxID=1628153 RepID=UPI003D32A893